MGRCQLARQPHPGRNPAQRASSYQLRLYFPWVNPNPDLRAANSTCTAAVMLGLALAEQYDLNRHVPERCLDTERRRRRARRRTQQ